MYPVLCLEKSVMGVHDETASRKGFCGSVARRFQSRASSPPCVPPWRFMGKPMSHIKWYVWMHREARCGMTPQTEAMTLGQTAARRRSSGRSLWAETSLRKGMLYPIGV